MQSRVRESWPSHPAAVIPMLSKLMERIERLFVVKAAPKIKNPTRPIALLHEPCFAPTNLLVLSPLEAFERQLELALWNSNSLSAASNLLAEHVLFTSLVSAGGTVPDATDDKSSSSSSSSTTDAVTRSSSSSSSSALRLARQRPLRHHHHHP